MRHFTEPYRTQRRIGWRNTIADIISMLAIAFVLSVCLFNSF